MLSASKEKWFQEIRNVLSPRPSSQGLRCECSVCPETQSSTAQVSASIDLDSPRKDRRSFGALRDEYFVFPLTDRRIFYLLPFPSDLEDLNPLSGVSMVPLFLFFSSPLYFPEALQGHKSIARGSYRFHVYTVRYWDFFFPLCFRILSLLVPKYAISKVLLKYKSGTKEDLEIILSDLSPLPLSLSLSITPLCVWCCRSNLRRCTC